MKSQVAQYQLDVEGIIAMLRGGGGMGGGSWGRGDGGPEIDRDPSAPLRQQLLWIRCIKPTLAMRPNTFDQQMVARQLAEGGVLRTFKALKGSGLSMRVPLQRFCRDTVGPIITAIMGLFRAKLEKKGGDTSSLFTTAGNAQVLLRKCEYSALCKLLLAPLNVPSSSGSKKMGGSDEGKLVPSLLDHLVASCSVMSLTSPIKLPAVQPHPSADNVILGVSKLFVNSTYYEQTLLPALSICTRAAGQVLACAALGLKYRLGIYVDYQRYQKQLRIDAAVRRIAQEFPIREALDKQRDAKFLHDQESRRSFFKAVVIPSSTRALKVQAKIKATIEGIGAEIERALRELTTMEATRREKEKQLRAEYDVEENAAAHRLAERQKILDAAEKYNEKKRLREFREQQAKVAAEEKKPVSTKREREILDEIAAAHIARIRAEKEAARQFTQQIQQQRRSASEAAVKKHLQSNVKRLTQDSKLKGEQEQQRAVAKELLLEYTIAQSTKKMEEARRNDLLIHSQNTGNRYEGSTMDEVDGTSSSALNTSNIVYRNSIPSDHRYHVPYSQHAHHKVSPIYALNTAPAEPPSMRFSSGGGGGSRLYSTAEPATGSSTPAGLVRDSSIATPNETLQRHQAQKTAGAAAAAEARIALTNASINASRERAWVAKEGRAIEEGARQRVMMEVLNTAAPVPITKSGELEDLVMQSLEEHKIATGTKGMQRTQTAAALAIAGRSPALSAIAPNQSPSLMNNTQATRALYRDALGLEAASKIVMASEVHHNWRQQQEQWAMQMESTDLYL